MFSLIQGIGYTGVVVCDDIYQNKEMVQWWNSIEQRRFDVTALGHGKSGTGVIDFGGQLHIRD